MKRFAADLPEAVPGGEEAVLLALNKGLTARFQHGPGRFTVRSNFVFRLAGIVIERLRTVENTEHLFRYCRQSLCHQTAQAMVDLATRRGIEARVVALDGHVVAEARYGGAWHGFDPDYGVVYRHGGRILSVEELADSPEKALQVYRDQRFAKSSDEVLEILRRKRITTVPSGEHLSPATARWQRRLHPLKWLTPLLGLAVGLAMLLWGT
jgi:hypothetical protein